VGRLIIGLGNPLRGDDGVGCRVVNELTRRGLPEGVYALDAGTPGLALLDLMTGYERVILVDAADMGLEPGCFQRMTPAEVHLLASAGPCSLHSLGLAEVLALAQALERPLPEIVIFGIQPAQVGWQEGLSPAVGAALPALAEALLKEIEGDEHAQDPGD
jgi:hydrogenase maturation protease